MKRRCPHQVVLDLLPSRNQQVPDSRDKAWKIWLKFLVVFLGVKSSVVADLGLEELQETGLLLILETQ